MLCAADDAKGSIGVKELWLIIQNERDDTDDTLVDATCDGKKHTATAMLADLRLEPGDTRVGACLTTRDGTLDPDSEQSVTSVCLSETVLLTLSDRPEMETSDITRR
ncbi:hypothetical protein GCM10023319_63840 [Nocardia iowensis]